MVDALLPALAPVLTRWTMGGSATGAAPAEWRSALDVEPGEAELRLLALTGQLLGALTLAEPAGAVQMRSDIPDLAKPPLEPVQRPRARRLLVALREPVQRRALLAMLDRRGWTMHPGDWMPGANEDDLPEIYSPWQDWAAQAGPQSMAIEDEISAENWDQFAPAVRRVAFGALRRRDPTRAAMILADVISGETPDRRLLFLDILAARLVADDARVLEALAHDRAPRVKARAAALLARLGRDDAGSDDAIELAGFFTARTKGWLRKSLEIVPIDLKTPAQRNRRATLMTTLSFGAMAQALDLTSEDLIAAWPWGTDVQTDHLVAVMIERSAADPLVRLAADAMTADAALNLPGLSPLLPRMPAEWRRQMGLRAMRADGATFAQGLQMAGNDGDIDGLIATAAGKKLLALLAESNEARPFEHAAELMALGLLASRDAARQALTRLTDAGLIASDPRLDMLRLNAALQPRGTRP